MSEFIDNVSKKRKEELKELILSLHNGKDLETAKAEFKEKFGEITTKEISQMEQALLAENKITVQEIQKLCDVHAAVFEGSISDIHNVLADVTNEPGHPLKVLRDENERIEKLIVEEIEPYLEVPGKTAMLMLRVAFDRLWEIDKHYTRKEMLMFPHLEKKGITAPPKVMWGVDDEIRRDIKEVINLLGSVGISEELVKEKVRAVILRVRDMIFKEDNILLPLLEANLKFVHWVSVDLASPEIGWFLTPPATPWNKEFSEEDVHQPRLSDDELQMSSGSLTHSEVDAILNTLPIDMTFVDKDGHVKYFSQGSDRIFARPQTILGRHVTMCHPPGSVDVVEKIIAKLRSGESNVEDFWIQNEKMFVHIRYFAVRDRDGNYLGVLETTQNIKPLRALVGEKRMAV